MSPSRVTIAFDLYGTLLSTESVSAVLAKRFGDDAAASLAALWRRYQLEYTWRLNSMGIYRQFSDCTRGALQHALAELKLPCDDIGELLNAYDALDTFPDVSTALAGLDSASIDAYIFSNGTATMVDAAVRSAPGLKLHANQFKGVVTVDEVSAFKPSKSTYDHLITKEGVEGSQIWLVSANPFDIVGARAAGLKAAWIDRAGTGWIDKLGDVIGDLMPNIVSSDLPGALATIRKEEGIV